MNTRTTLSISEARKKIFKISDEVQKPGVYYFLTEKGSPKVVVMSAMEFESWLETIQTVKEFLDLKKDIKEVRKDIKEGGWKKYKTLEEVMSDYGFIADKSKQKYGVAAKNKTKSKNRPR